MSYTTYVQGAQGINRIHAHYYVSIDLEITSKLLIHVNNFCLFLTSQGKNKDLNKRFSDPHT